jgi:hypothetical protein
MFLFFPHIDSQGYFYQTFDIRWIYLAPFFDIIGGGQVILGPFLYTYISEGTDSKHL